MKRAMFVACLATAVAAYHLVGAEPEKKAEPQPASPSETPQQAKLSEQSPAPEQQPADVTEPVIPKRELVFEEKEEPFEMALFAADPEVLQQRFVAIVRLDAEQTIQTNPLVRSKTMDRMPQRLSRSSRDYGGLFRFMAQNAPHDRLPSPDLVESLTDRSSLHVRAVPNEEGYGGSNMESTMSFVVLAPTRERAKELTRAAITLFDYGLSYPIQREFLIRKRPQLEYQATSRASLREIEAEAAGYEKQLEASSEYEDVTQEALNGLITQQRLISVDLAGVRARIAACTKILTGRDQLRPSQVEQVEQIKITAEIELAGLEARKAAIDQIVGKAADRRELSEKLAAARARAEVAEKRIDSAQISINLFESERHRYEPLTIEGGVIPIHPIKWISAEERKGAS
jgi:hypothetical protein